MLRQCQSVKGMADLAIFTILGQPNLNIKVDPAKAARYGLNTGDVNTVVQAALGGTVATNVLESDRVFNLTVRLAPAYRNSIESVGNVKVGYQTPSGVNAYIPLKELATISLDSGASYIYHEATSRFIPIKFSVRGRDLGSTVAEAQQKIAQNVKLPTGYRIIWAGEFEDLQVAQNRLAIFVPLSLGLVLILLYSLFNSLRNSLLALAGIPFCVAGGILSLVITGQPFSVSAAIGFISLFGVAVMNGILVITFYNELARKMSPFKAMEHAAEKRMRPMLMTAFSACIGLLPRLVTDRSSLMEKWDQKGAVCWWRQVSTPSNSYGEINHREQYLDRIRRSTAPRHVKSLNAETAVKQSAPRPEALQAMQGQAQP